MTMKKFYCLFFLIALFKNSAEAQHSPNWRLYKPVWKLPIEKFYRTIAKHNEFPVRFKAGTTQTQIINLERKLREKFGPDFKVKTCQCDPLLRNYSGLNIIEILKHGEELAVKPKGNGAGDSEPISMNNVLYMSPNYITHSDRESNIVSSFSPPNEFGSIATVYKNPFRDFSRNYRFIPTNNNSFKIGVFDTGFDFITDLNLVQSIDQNSNTTLCSPYGQNSPQDDDITRHGTLVTALLLNQLKGVPVKVYPVKVLDKDGKGSLFDFVCALASQDQMTAYNISLGFYADTASFPKKLVSAYMNRKNGWFFVAAGNKIAALDNELNDQSRNLLQRKYKFYPACLTDVPRMIVVTTAQRQQGDGKYKYAVCSNQNYSSQFAHVGVIPSGQDCLLGFSGVGGTGTSFAAPIMLGRTLAAWHQGRPNQQSPRSPNHRGEFFGRPYPVFTHSEPTLTPQQIDKNRLIEETVSYTKKPTKLVNSIPK